jgi:hypothetical protein
VLRIDFTIVPMQQVRRAFWQRAIKSVDTNRDGRFSHAELINLLLLLGNDDEERGGTVGAALQQPNSVLALAAASEARVASPVVPDDARASSLESVDLPVDLPPKPPPAAVDGKVADGRSLRKSSHERFQSIEILGTILRVSVKALRAAEEITGLTADSTETVDRCAARDALAAAGCSGGSYPLVNLARCPITNFDLTTTGMIESEYARICFLTTAMDVATREDQMATQTVEEEAEAEGASWLMSVSEYDHIRCVGRPYRSAGSVRDRTTGVVRPELVPSKVWSALLVGYASRHYRLIKSVVERTERAMTRKFGIKMNNPDPRVAAAQMAGKRETRSRFPFVFFVVVIFHLSFLSSLSFACLACF